MLIKLSLNWLTLTWLHIEFWNAVPPWGWLPLPSRGQVASKLHQQGPNSHAHSRKVLTTPLVRQAWSHSGGATWSFYLSPRTESSSCYLYLLFLYSFYFSLTLPRWFFILLILLITLHLKFLCSNFCLISIFWLNQV